MKNILSFIGLFTATLVGVLVSLVLLNRFEGSVLNQVVAIASFLVLYALSLLVSHNIAGKLINRFIS